MSKTKTAMLDLDDLQNEHRREPFTVAIGGTTFEMQDIQDVDLGAVTAAFERAKGGDISALVFLIVSEDDREAFFANDLPIWKFQALFERYLHHYGLDVATGTELRRVK